MGINPKHVNGLCGHNFSFLNFKSSDVCIKYKNETTL